MLRYVILIFVSFSISVVSAAVIEVKIGVPKTLGGFKAVASKTHQFNFYPYSYNLKMMNDFISGKLTAAVLPEEYVLMSIWTFDTVEVVSKFSEHRFYLIIDKTRKKFDIARMAGRKILVRENSLDGYYLKKILGNLKYEIVYSNVNQIQNYLRNKSSKNDSDYAVILSEEEYAKVRELNLISKSYEGGNYYVVSLGQDNWILGNDLNKKKLSESNFVFSPLLKSDAIKFRELNKVILKKGSSEDLFQAFDESILQGLK